MKATFCPGLKAMRSRTSFGIEIWNFDETVAVAAMRFTNRLSISIS